MGKFTVIYDEDAYASGKFISVDEQDIEPFDTRLRLTIGFLVDKLAGIRTYFFPDDEIAS
ncbi:MAG: hypothetical protein HFJ17_02770 [Clostridia bacterium]|nr:hypothetical protein [Clostridia bacterium]